MPAAAILDIDGTLVDTNYQHAIAWFRAFRDSDLVVPIWRIHRAIGMGGDQLVTHLIGEEGEEEHGDAVRDAEHEHYAGLIDEVVPLEGARDLIVALKDRGLTVVLASSAKEEELDHYLDLLDAREIADDWTSSADVGTTKPAPDLVEAAQEKAGVTDAVMIGDTPWDIEAAAKADVPTVAVMTGGFDSAELKEAGAKAVYEALPPLIDELDRLGIGVGR